MASEGAGKLAEAIEAINLELLQLVRGISEEQSRTAAKDEGDSRTVGVIAHHVGHRHLNTAEWIDSAISAHEVNITLQEINVENAEHAATYHDVAREETIRLLTETGDRLRDMVAALTDEQLAQTAFHQGAGREMTVEALAQLGHRHVSGHLATIRGAIDLA